MHLRKGQPTLTIQLPRAFGAAPAWPNLTLIQLQQQGWGIGLGLRLLLQGDGALSAQLQLDIAKRWQAAQLQQPVFERISTTKWQVSCGWCDGLWKPSSMSTADVNDWATDTALQVLEYVLVCSKACSLSFRQEKSHERLALRALSTGCLRSDCLYFVQIIPYNQAYNGILTFKKVVINR